MNILVISNCELNPNQGSGYVICGFASEMRRRGHFVTAYGPEHFLPWPKTRRLKRIRLLVGYTAKALREVITKKRRYDVIELWGSVGWLACLIIKRCRLGRYIVVSRSNGLEPHYRESTEEKKLRRSLMSMFLNFTDSLGYANADLLTLVSNYDEEYAILKRYREKKSIITIENPLRQEFLKQRFVERQKFVMGYVGSWTDRKGCQQLIKTINLLNINGYKGEWLIIGIGAAGKKEILNNTALTFDQVIENVSRNELISYYNQMSMLIVLSWYESFGMVSSEAMSCGALLVSTNVGFANSLIDGKNYIKIDRNKCAENASLIIDIQQHWHHYKQMAMEGQQRVQTLEWQKAADTLEEVYSRHLNI